MGAVICEAFSLATSGPTPFALYYVNDPVSGLLHLAGAAVCTVAGFALVRGTRGWARVSLAIFAFAAVLLLTCSGLFHVWHRGPGREVLRRVDHAAIFVLIAGTFTPIHAILFRGPSRWVMLWLIWGMALVGALLKLVFINAIDPWVGIITYVVMGWMGLFAFVKLSLKFGVMHIIPLLLGGVAYTVGAVIEGANWPMIWPRLIRPHELFHIAVLLGLWGHWVFIARIARGLRRGDLYAPLT